MTTTAMIVSAKRKQYPPTAPKHIVVGRMYLFYPTFMDRTSPQYDITLVKPWHIVTAIERPGASKTNFGGQCHIESLSGHYIGRISCNSLIDI